MTLILRRIAAVLILLWLGFGLAACASLGGNNRGNIPLSAQTVAQLKAMGSSPREAMVVRIFKQERTLEIWKRTTTGEFKLFRGYDICAYSGNLGPKFMEGDMQSPEGFYTIVPGLMNPNSSYFLAFNTGFPNKFDRANGRRGSYLMVHGDCKSVGCYAMTDASMAEIYALARESFRGGNTAFQVQIFPFRMTADNMAKQTTNPHFEFWKNIKQGYDYFEATKSPPAWDVCERRYIFNPQSTTPLDPMGYCPPTIQNAALSAHQQADDARFSAAVAADQRKLDEAAAIRARGQAINGAVSGFWGNITGAQTPAPVAQPPALPAATQS